MNLIMLIQRLLRVILIFIGLVTNNIVQAEEEVFYPSSIKKLQKEIEGEKENPLSSEHLRKLCHQEYLNISNKIVPYQKPEEHNNDGEITILNNENLTKEERNFLQSNWSGSILFSDQELENIKTIMEE